MAQMSADSYHEILGTHCLYATDQMIQKRARSKHGQHHALVCRRLESKNFGCRHYRNEGRKGVTRVVKLVGMTAIHNDTETDTLNTPPSGQTMSGHYVHAPMPAQRCRHFFEILCAHLSSRVLTEHSVVSVVVDDDLTPHLPCHYTAYTYSRTSTTLVCAGSEKSYFCHGSNAVEMASAIPASWGGTRNKRQSTSCQGNKHTTTQHNTPTAYQARTQRQHINMEANSSSTYLAAVGPIHLVAVVNLGVMRCCDHYSGNTFVLLNAEGDKRCSLPPI